MIFKGLLSAIKNLAVTMWKHKFLTVLATFLFVAFVGIIPSLIAGTLATAMPFQALVVATIVAGIETVGFGITQSMIASIKRKEASSVKALQKEENVTKLRSTRNEKKYVKLCKKFLNNRLKLAKLEKASWKAISVSTPKEIERQGKFKKLYFKRQVLRAKKDKFEYEGQLTGSTSKISKAQKYQNKIDEYTDKFNDMRESEESTYGQLNWIRKVKLSDGSTVDLPKTRIYCNSAKTLNEFTEKTKNVVGMENKKAITIKIEYSNANTTFASFLDASTKKDIANIIFNEVEELSDGNPSLFPIRYVETVGSKKREIVLNTAEDLTNLRNSDEFKTLTR